MEKNRFIDSQLPFILALPALLWQVLFLVIPILIIIGFAFIHHGQLSFTHVYALLDADIFAIIFRSVVLAVTTALCCLLLGYPVAYFIAMSETRMKPLLLFLLTLPFWTNFLIQIYAWFYLLERNGLIAKFLRTVGLLPDQFSIATTQFAIFLVAIYCYLPFMILPLYATLSKIDKNLLEASRDLGASTLQTFMRITLPLSAPGIITGFLLVMVPVFGEFAIPSLMGGSRYMYVGSLIYYYFLVTRDVGLGATFTILAGCILLVLTLIMYMLFAYSRKVEKLL